MTDTNKKRGERIMKNIPLIAILDDDEEIAEALAQFLKDAGYQLIT
jgi:FixJ family two-component response regulator